VFDQFDWSIVSSDMLKRDNQIRDAPKHSHWDLIVIDEAHTAATGKNTSETIAQTSNFLLLLTPPTSSEV